MSYKFGKRSLDNLNGVNPLLINVLNRALEISPVDFGIIQGKRSIDEQRKNVAKGVSQTMNSRHLEECSIDENVCYGNAVDILPTAIKPGMNWDLKYFMPVLKAIKQAGDELGVELRFGVNWKNDPSLPIETKFIDAPHVEIPR